MPKAATKLVHIPLHYSFAVAMAILNRIRIPASLKETVWAHGWSNGREQGLHIGILPRTTYVDYGINIAQQRSSDSILLVHGPSDEFDSQSSQMTSKLYSNPRNRICFESGERGIAVRFIQKLICIVNQEETIEGRDKAIGTLVEKELARQTKKHLEWSRSFARQQAGRTAL